MKLGWLRKLVLAIAAVAILSNLLSSSALAGDYSATKTASGTVSLGHPATWPYAVTELSFLSERCQSSPFQGLDAYVFDLGDNNQRKEYWLEISALAQVGFVNLIFYEPAYGRCIQTKAYWYSEVPDEPTAWTFPDSKIDGSRVRWLVVSFPAGVNIEVTLTWW